MEAVAELQNLDDFATVSREFRELPHGIWQNFPRKTVGPSDDRWVPMLKIRPVKNLGIVLDYHDSRLIFWLHAFEIGHFCNFRISLTLTLTLTLDRVIQHIVV